MTRSSVTRAEISGVPGDTPSLTPIESPSARGVGGRSPTLTPALALNRYASVLSAVLSAGEVDAVTRKRLTFFVGQPVVPRERGKKGRYDDAMNTHGALCFGKADGAVLMTGKGAGGVELIPAGHVDMSGDWAKAGYAQHEWPAVYLYHVPWIKKAPFKGAPAGAASYVVSGYSIADGDESSDSE